MSTLTLNTSPTDIISKTLFADNSHLLVSSWDKSISLYNTDTNSQTYTIASEAPILDCAFYLAGNPNLWAYGGLEKKVHYHDVTSAKDIILGEHDSAVKSIVTYTPKGLIISGSWDKSIKGWSINAPHEAFTTNVSDKIYAMATAEHFLAVGTADKNISVYDVRKMAQPFFVRSSGFAHHIRSICWIHNNEGYAAASSEGRVAVEFVTSSKKAFSFKCHRLIKEDTTPPTTLVYPINALGVHPKYGSLATGGSDSTVCMWDIESKKRISKVQVPCSVQTLAFNKEGNKLAIGCSYNMDGGVKDKTDSHNVYIHAVSDSDVKLGVPLPPPAK